MADIKLSGEYHSDVNLLLEEIRSLKADAERYRWLRKQPNDFSAPRIDICYWHRNGDDSVNEGDGLRLLEADVAIDSAMRSEAKRDGL